MTTPSKAMQLFMRTQEGPIRSSWHWLDYNFNPFSRGFMTVGLPTIRALAAVDQYMPGYADEQLTRLEGFSGREYDMGHYQQIISWYAELLVLLQLADHTWPDTVSFEMEPTAGRGKANPEVVVSLQDVGSLGVEVKAPNLRDHQATRSAQAQQLNSRSAVFQRDAQTTLPRDNPVKDFLTHSDKKFRGFRTDPDFCSVLVIVWDDYVYEPVTALLDSESGLFTPNSFHTRNGIPVTYPNVDAVVLVRHQHQIVRGLAGKALADGRRSLLDYGLPNEFPEPALVINPAGRPVPAAFQQALNAIPIEALTGAEYQTNQIVRWSTG